MMGRADSAELDVETVPLTRTSSGGSIHNGISSSLFQRTSSSNPDVEDNNTHTPNNTNNRSTATAVVCPSSRHSLQSSCSRSSSALQSLWQLFWPWRRVLGVLLLEFVFCRLLLHFGTSLPGTWQRERCAAELADRPPPFQRLASSNEIVLDPSLRHPLKDSTISSEFLVWTSIQLPIWLVFLVALMCADTKTPGGDSNSSKNLLLTGSDPPDAMSLPGVLRWVPQTTSFAIPRVAHAVAATSALLATIAVSEFITQTLKVVVARRRPNFYAWCEIDTSEAVCTNPDLHARCEAQYSFPSGHSSLTMCACTFLSWFLVSHLLRWRQRRQTMYCPLLRLTIAATLGTLLGWALYVAATRLTDHYHHYDDVVAGLVLGATVATTVFHVFFPPLWHSQVATPWSVVFLQQPQPGQE